MGFYVMLNLRSIGFSLPGNPNEKFRDWLSSVENRLTTIKLKNRNCNRTIEISKLNSRNLNTKLKSRKIKDIFQRLKFTRCFRQNSSYYFLLLVNINKNIQRIQINETNKAILLK